MTEPARTEDDRRRRRRGAWLLVLLLLLIALAVGIVLAAWDSDSSKGSSNSSQAATKGRNTAAQAEARLGVLDSGGTNVLARAPGKLTPFAGKAATARNARVVSVVGDEVFWIGTADKDQDRVLVHLRTNGESAPKVTAGRRVSFSGSIVANGKGDAGLFGVKDAEGAALLKRERVHVETDVSTLKVSS